MFHILLLFVVKLALFGETVKQSISLSICRPVCLLVSQSVCWLASLSVGQPVCLLVSQSVCWSASLSVSIPLSPLEAQLVNCLYRMIALSVHHLSALLYIPSWTVYLWSKQIKIEYHISSFEILIHSFICFNEKIHQIYFYYGIQMRFLAWLRSWKWFG